MKRFALLTLFAMSCASDPTGIVLYVGAASSGPIVVEVRDASEVEGGEPEDVFTLTIEDYQSGAYESLLLLQSGESNSVELTIRSETDSRDVFLLYGEGMSQAVLCVEERGDVPVESYTGDPGVFRCNFDPCAGVECEEPEEACQVSECQEGECVTAEAPEGADCPGGTCTDGECRECRDSSDCDVSECQIADCTDTGLCERVNAPNGTFCTNGMCLEGECVVNCLAGCPMGTECDESTGRCVRLRGCGADTDCAEMACAVASCGARGICEYRSLCSEELVCERDSGTCVECTTDSHCDDEDPCTIGRCSEERSCVFLPRCEAACTDAGACVECTETDLDACGPGGSCFEGQCVECASSAECDDGNPCTMDTCSPSFLCEHIPSSEGMTCAAGRICVSGGCVSALCSGPGTCAHPSECILGLCGGIGRNCEFQAYPLDPPGPLTRVPCATGVCESGACVTPTCEGAADCDDAIACTRDLCVDGSCVHQNQREGLRCGSGGVCQAGVCESNDDFCRGETWTLLDAEGHERYVVCGREASWDEASNQCRAAGGHLASFATISEYTGVSMQLAADVGEEAGDIWIGMRDVLPGGPITLQTHRWVDGSNSVSEVPWEFREPNEPDSCGRIDAITQRWRDRSCELPFAFMCEFGPRN